MDARARLFQLRKMYDHEGAQALFTQALRENIAHHRAHCPYYARLLAREGFAPEHIRTAEDAAAIPPIPAVFFKRHEVRSLPPEQMALHATSSGTQGQRSQIDLDEDTLSLGMRMALRTFKTHGLISPVPANYILLVPEPEKGNEMGAVKTAMGVSRLAPPLARTFALRSAPGGYEPDFFGVLGALARYAKSPFPLRFVGFPAYLAKLIEHMEHANLTYRFSPLSRVILGGGWKQFAGEEIDRALLYRRVQERLGISPLHCRDFYSAVEHPLPYAQCRCHRFHVPTWSRVIIRDPASLAPVGYGTPGLLNFVTPLVRSAPLVSVVMGDLAVLHPAGMCDCGINAPCFELLGRAGGPARNCAIAASEWMGGSR